MSEISSALRRNIGSECIFREMFFCCHGRFANATEDDDIIKIEIDRLPSPGFVWLVEGRVVCRMRTRLKERSLIVLRDAICAFPVLSSAIYFEAETVSATQALAAEIQDLERAERMKRLGTLLLTREAQLLHR